jgi:hypothetical protein
LSARIPEGIVEVMDLDKRIRDFQRDFQELYLEAIPLLHQKTRGRQSGHFLSFSTIFSGIECLASVRSGELTLATGTRFKKFVHDYFGRSSKYAEQVDALWELRCHLAHSFTTGGKFFLTHNNASEHFRMTNHGTCLNAETFLTDFTVAANRYFADLQSVKGVRQKFDSAVKQTGSIRSHAIATSVPDPKKPKVMIQVCNQFSGTNATSRGSSSD